MAKESDKFESLFRRRQFILIIILLLAGLTALLWPVRIPDPPVAEISEGIDWPGHKSEPLRRSKVPAVPMPGGGIAAREEGLTGAVAAIESTNRVAVGADGDVMPGERVLTFFSASDRERFLAAARDSKLSILDRMDFGNALRLRENAPGELERVLRIAPTPTANHANPVVRPPPLQEVPEEDMPDAPYLAVGEHALSLMGLYDWNPEMGTGLKIAMLDGVVDQSALRQGAKIEFIDLSGNPAEKDAVFMQHGTAVASLLIGRRGTDGGIVPGAELLAYNVLEEQSSGNVFALAKSLIDAVDRGAAVINLSVGSREDSPLLLNAVEYALQRGVLLVAAAGNDGRAGLFFPAAYDGVLAVGAADASGRRLPFSNTGMNLGVLGPGLGLSAAAPDGRVTGFSGTSAASPLVAGAAGLLLSREKMEVDAVLERIRSAALSTDDENDSLQYGAGLIDAGRSLAVPDGVDAVVMIPFLKPARPGFVEVVTPVANRGDETAHNVQIVVRVENSYEQTVTLRLRPGMIIRQEWVMPVDMNVPVDGWLIEIFVTVHGVVDLDVGNNIFRGRLRLP